MAPESNERTDPARATNSATSSATARTSAGAGDTGSAGRAALHGGPDWQAAASAVCTDLQPAEGKAPDLALIFVDGRFEAHYEAIIQMIQERLRPAHLIGCSGHGVIGPGLEAEETPAISCTVFDLPGVALRSLAIVPGETVDDDLAILEGDAPNTWLLFADPFSLDTEHLVEALRERRPQIVLIGGMASAAAQAAGTAVFLDQRVLRRGAAILGLGGVAVRSVVAQGAEPIGQPWTITDCEENLVKTIGLRPALTVLRETLHALDPATMERAQRNLLVGLAMDEYRDEFGRGDYLIRNIQGADPESGAIAINAIARIGQTFQFQFRDTAAADADLRQHLADFRTAYPDETVLGALLCSCNGRGRGLFGTPDHDAAALAAAFGPVPTAGFFCNGEIGPVGGKNFLHGFTASIALITAPGGNGAAG